MMRFPLLPLQHVAMGQVPVPPVNRPIPTKIDQNGWCTYPKIVPLVLTHSHVAKDTPMMRGSFGQGSDAQDSVSGFHQCARFVSCVSLEMGTQSMS